jgi:hypothetical protein
MTVCIATFAERAKAIVMLSDKAVTYPSGLQSDTGVTKSRRIGDSCWHVLIAGNPTFALKVVNLASKKLEEIPTTVDSVFSMMDCLSECYQAMRDKSVNEVILRPNLLTRDLVVSRPRTLLPLQDDVVLAIHENAAKYKVKTSLLVCGFDESGPHIFSVSDPGVSENFDMTGFHAVGIGASTAIARMLQLEAVREDALPLALYQIFDAKVNAEIMQGVGYSTDAEILVKDRKKTVKVPIRIIRLIDNVFMSHPNTPFSSERSPQAPRRWESRLQQFANSVMNTNRKR